MSLVGFNYYFPGIGLHISSLGYPRQEVLGEALLEVSHRILVKDVKRCDVEKWLRGQGNLGNAVF